MIHIHDHKPDPKFLFGSGDDKMYFGIELEVEFPEEKDLEKLSEILYITNENIYIKADSSIRHGFEIVSHPATYNYHKDKFGWDKLIDKVIELGGYIDTTCGMHVHIGREYFENDKEVGGKVVIFFTKHWDKLRKLSGRLPYKLRYCKRPRINIEEFKSYDSLLESA